MFYPLLTLSLTKQGQDAILKTERALLLAADPFDLSRN